jgi:hypothetical protein
MASASLLAAVFILQAPVLDESSYGRWRDFVFEHFQAQRDLIPWRTTLAEGARDAAREGKPILLWAMNGHPLGCT